MLLSLYPESKLPELFKIQNGKNGRWALHHANKDNYYDEGSPNKSGNTTVNLATYDGNKHYSKDSNGKDLVQL